MRTSKMSAANKVLHHLNKSSATYKYVCVVCVYTYIIKLLHIYMYIYYNTVQVTCMVLVCKSAIHIMHMGIV